jgi:beta-galactosidase
MNKRFFIALLVLTCATTMLAHQRAVLNLSFGWRFHAGDVKNAEQKAFGDTDWRTVNVPHDFQIEQPWVAPAADEKADNSDAAANIKSRLSSRGFKEMGKGWYRLHFTPADSLRGRRLLLQFDGILYTADVYLNGERIGGTDYGYVGFEIDVTDKLKFGQENVIAVLADTREPGNSRWYTGGGIFRDVRLVATGKELFFERHPLYITTRENKFVNVSGEFTNRTRKPAKTLVKIYAPDGSLVFEGGKTINRHRMARTVETALCNEVTIADAKLWDTEHPQLYRVVAQLFREDGSLADEVCSTFGIRTVEIVPNKGLLLNGKKVLLQGYANHHTLGALGAAAYPRAIEKRIQLMKQFGINHIRTSHNPYSREFIELCDKYGILVVDELYDKWTRQHTGGRVGFTQLWQSDIPEWIKRDRNSPSVVLWSLGNELQQDPNQPFNDFGVTMYRLMRPLVARYDSTRKVTVAMHPRYRNWETDSLPCELAKITDVQSYNYRYMYFPGDGRRFPWMTFYQSEASTQAMGQNFFEMELDKVIGLAYWGAIDYLGESMGWPAKGWSQGVFYIDLEPKPKAYYMKSFFCPDEPVVHLAFLESENAEMWNGVKMGNDRMSELWNRPEGAKVNVYIYTNGDEVELLLNGKSLGRKENPKGAKLRNQIRWGEIDYKAGRLEAVAYRNGKAVARHQVETTGEAVRLIAEPDRQSPKTKSSKKGSQFSAESAQLWQADGMDLQHVRIVAVDKKGRKVLTAQQEVSFKVEGNAEIVGVINGDITSNEMTVGTKRSLFNGCCTVILRSTRQAGPVTLTASAPGMKEIKLQMETK